MHVFYIIIYLSLLYISLLKKLSKSQVLKNMLVIIFQIWFFGSLVLKKSTFKWCKTSNNLFRKYPLKTCETRSDISESLLFWKNVFSLSHLHKGKKSFFVNLAYEVSAGDSMRSKHGMYELGVTIRRNSTGSLLIGSPHSLLKQIKAMGNLRNLQVIRYSNTQCLLIV